MVRLACWLSCLFLLAPFAARAQTPQPPKHILVLYERAAALSPVRHAFFAALVNGARSATSARIDIYEETFDPSLPASRPFQVATRGLMSKYKGRRIDVIVAMGGAPLALARLARRRLGDPPIVAIVGAPGQLDVNDNVTGLQGGFSIDGTLDLALALRPDTRSVLVIAGSSGSGGLQVELERQLQARRHLGFMYLRDLSLGDVVSRVAAAPEHSVVLFVKQNMASPDERLLPVDAARAIASASRVPVFSQFEEAVGVGTVGGYMWDFQADAGRIARMALQIATGTHLRELPPGRNTYRPLVDWRALQRWAIPASRVPDGTTILFRPQSFFQLYRTYVVGGALVFAGQLALIVGLAVQRMRRRRAEAESRRSEERYRSVVDTQSELICRFLPDTTLTFVNDAYCRFANKRRRQLLGTKFIELIPEAARPAVLDRLRRLFHGVESVEHEVLLSDGTIGWQHWINQPVIDDRGKLLEFQGVGRDITDRKRAEQALSRSEARNSAMLRAIPDLMFVIARDGTYLDYHARDPTLLFAEPGAFIGRTVRDIMPPALAGTLMDAIERACDSHEAVVVEYELPLDGTRHFEARLVRVDADRVLSIVRDVTEARRALQINRDFAGRLIASQEAERQRIARELHDDLSQKIALLNIEIDQIAGRIRADDGRSRVRLLSARIGEIATDVHNLSHELHPSKLQVLGLVAAVQSLCRDVSQQSGVQVVFTHDTLPPGIDPNVSLCLYRIAQESLHNVARHSRAREAQVRLTHEADGLVLQVRDSGVGFDTRRRGDGGLGLVSMRERVAFIRGHLAIDAYPGGGTRITVRAPIPPPVLSAIAPSA